MKDTTFGAGGWTPKRLGPLTGKTFAITGASSGTGFEASRILLAAGARVVMLNRSADRSAAAIGRLKEEFGANADVRLVLTDLADLASVRRAAREILDTLPRIDALICNAAIAQVPARRLTRDGFESQLGTNHFGHFVLCGMLFDRIEESCGRIVVVASLGYKMGSRTIRFDDMNWERDYHPNRAYSQSKLAQMMFAFELQDRIRAAGRHVRVLVCHPGAAATSLIRTSGSRAARLVFGLMALSPMVQSAERGAFPQVMCATEDGLEEKALHGPTGCLEWVGPVGRGTLEPFALDKTVAARLWARSEQEAGFTWSV